MSSISLADVVQEDAPTFEEWLNNQDFDYSRVESEVIDYVNNTINYDKLEDSVTKASEIDGWEAYFEDCGIEEESKRATAVKSHIRAYIKISSD